MRILLFAIVSLILSACQIDAVVDVEVLDDGSGTVTVTAAFNEAVIEAAPELVDALRTEDLAAAGWAVEELENTPQSVVVSATKGFTSPDDLNGVLGEIEVRTHSSQTSRWKGFVRSLERPSKSPVWSTP